MSFPPQQSAPPLLVPTLDPAGTLSTPPPPPPKSPLPDQSPSLAPVLPSPTPSARSAHYQGKVSGLEGWNDAPSQPFVRKSSPANSTDPEAGDPVFITDKLSEILEACRSLSQARVFADTEKRLRALFEKFGPGGEGVPPSLLAKLTELTKALDSKDFDAAQAAHIVMLTGHFENEGRWMVGVKRLIEMYKTHCNG